MANQSLVLLLGLALGFSLAQIRNEKCGDGRICICSETTRIISCVDSNLFNLPSFSTRIRSWVKRINLRFNFIVDLSRLLHQDFPKLEYVDVRNNEHYACNEIHHMLVSKGLVIDSHCPEEETTIIIRTTPLPIRSKSTQKPTPRPTTKATTRGIQMTTFDAGQGSGESTELYEEDTTDQTTSQTNIDVSGNIDVTGRVQCDMSFTVSITAISSSFVTSIIGVVIHYLCKRLRNKSENFNRQRRQRSFDEPRPSVSNPVHLFDDLSQRRGPIYTGTLTPQSFANANYSMNSDSEEQVYEIPIPPGAPEQPVRPSAPLAPPPPPPSNRGKAPLSGRVQPTKSSAKKQPPPRPSSAPGSLSSARGKGRGRGVRSIPKTVPSVSITIDDKPPARNTRSQTKNTTFTTHM